MRGLIHFWGMYQINIFLSLHAENDLTWTLYIQEIVTFGHDWLSSTINILKQNSSFYSSFSEINALKFLENVVQILPLYSMQSHYNLSRVVRVNSFRSAWFANSLSFQTRKSMASFSSFVYISEYTNKTEVLVNYLLRYRIFVMHGITCIIFIALITKAHSQYQGIISLMFSLKVSWISLTASNF